MIRIPVAKKVRAEMELHASKWNLVGVKATEAISIDKAEKNALELNLSSMVKADLHMAVTKLKSAIMGILMGREVTKNEHTLLPVSDWSWLLLI